MYNLTEKQKEVIHNALITASDNGTLDEFTNEELKLINRAETIVNKLTIPVVSQQRELLITALEEANRTGYLRLFTKADAIAEKLISGNL